MSKRVIQAKAADPEKPELYLLGYRDDGEQWQAVWTISRSHARWFDAEEAEVEVQLLHSVMDPWHQLSPQPVGV
jgi:hypothetical protein